MKLGFFFAAILCFPALAIAEVVYLDSKINEISAYDDWENGIVIVSTVEKHPSCSAGSYLNPSSPGFEHLLSVALVAATSKKEVRVQLYDDRKLGSRCEIDAIRLYF